VLSSPSGAGKTTISRSLLESDPNLSLSISATTRPRRPGEVNGRDYFFVSPEKFAEMAEEGGFLESATVFDHSYGTPRAPVEEVLSEGGDVLFDIDWQGTQQLAERSPKDLVRVFVLPPSTAELERRLYTRAQDPEEVVKGRMAKAADEMVGRRRRIIDGLDRAVAGAGADLDPSHQGNGRREVDEEPGVLGQVGGDFSGCR